MAWVDPPPEGRDEPAELGIGWARCNDNSEFNSDYQRIRVSAGQQKNRRLFGRRARNSNLTKTLAGLIRNGQPQSCRSCRANYPRIAGIDLVAPRQSDDAGRSTRNRIFRAAAF
jgi:hypothetical protein